VANSSVLPRIENYPILNQQEASKIFHAQFEKDCGDNELCESDLHVAVSTDLAKDESGLKSLLVLGRDSTLTLNVTVANFGEPAYETMLYISHPKSMPYISLVDDVRDLLFSD